jgi:hypothetical protein
MFHIREVLGPTLSQETGYSELFLRVTNALQAYPGGAHFK